MKKVIENREMFHNKNKGWVVKKSVMKEYQEMSIEILFTKKTKHERIEKSENLCLFLPHFHHPL